jgi:lipopolysaccharide/colanic/teichoic acid biosynthesis glycosyltransferase
LSTHPPASMPAEEHQQPAEASTAPLVRSKEEQSTSLSVALERDGHVVIDLTEPSRPLVIDLVRPEIAPPDVPSYRTESVERLGRVGMLAARRWQLATKRLIDIVGSLSILTVFSPLMLVIAIAIRLTSPGPVIYAQRRVGKGGRSFTMWKFRSMIDGAHELRDRHEHRNRHTVGPVFKIQYDPRITRIGRVIRRFSLDELPQLLNVLRGDMSLVGPRPALPEEFALCNEHIRQRTLVPPGLTCIWQVSGRSDVDFLRWVDMDLAYIRSWSLWLDLKLLVLTLPAVVRGRGAY